MGIEPSALQVLVLILIPLSPSFYIARFNAIVLATYYGRFEINVYLSGAERAVLFPLRDVMNNAR